MATRPGARSVRRSTNRVEKWGTRTPVGTEATTTSDLLLSSLVTGAPSAAQGPHAARARRMDTPPGSSFDSPRNRFLCTVDLLSRRSVGHSPHRQRIDTPMQGFKKFLLQGNVVELAVAVIIAGAFGKVVDAVVKSFN